MLRSLLKPHTSQSNSNCPRRDNDYLVPILLELDSRLHNDRKCRKKRLMVLLVNDGAGPFNQVIRILLDYLQKAEDLTELYDNCHGL